MSYFPCNPPSRARAGAALLAGMVLAATAGGGNAEWQQRFVIAEARANLEIACRPDNQGSIRLRLASENGEEAVTLGMGGDGSFFKADGPGELGQALAKRVILPELPAVAPEATIILTAKRRERGWTFFLDDRPAAFLPEVFSGPVMVATPADLVPAGDDVPEPFLQRIGRVMFQDDFMIPPDAETPLVNWEVLRGEWGLHTVERTDREPRRARGRSPTPARSANFYSLSGQGERAMIVSGTEFDDHLIFRASVQHGGGASGIVFLYRPESGSFHALTAEDDPHSDGLLIVLWRGRTGEEEREILKVFRTDLPSGQWLLLESQIFDDRLLVRVNRRKLGLARVAIPPGGQFGLYSNAGDGARFDDVWARSHDDVALHSDEDWRRLAGSDSLVRLATAKAADRVEAEAAGKPLMTTRGENPGRLRLGAPGDAPRRLDLDLWLPRQGDSPAGIELGEEGENELRWRLLAEPLPENRLALRLEAGSNGVFRARDTFTVRRPDDKRPLRLALDATRKGEIRGLLDDTLMVVEAPVAPVTGPAALFVPPGSVIGRPATIEHPALFQDKVEENPSFVEDRFMRHWASPEGQWVTFPDELTWFRGDFFAGVRVTMPVLFPSELHLAVPPSGSNGTVRLISKDGASRLYAPVEEGKGKAELVAEWTKDNYELSQLKDIGRQPLATIHLEGHCLWVTSGDRLLWRGHLPEAATVYGSRIRMHGLDVPALKHTMVQRDNVLDVLFTDSPHEWTIHGGQWEVVNRFACEPTWSHMGGENPDGLAALWSGYEFSGDFSAEMFAGMRHGWYDRVGDLNLTVMNRRHTPGDGYTVICTGWDPDWSQEFSRLLRQGEEIDRSDQYLAPRRRENNQRRGYEPLLASGRDVHGAWYYLRLRRVQGRLEYSFDNERVFELADEDPISRGGLGIWTYRNSLMVARVRMAAETVRPAAFAIRPLAVEDFGKTVGAAPDSHDLSDARHAMTLDPDRWSVADCPAGPLLRPMVLDNEQILKVRAAQAGGLMQAAPDFPALPTASLAGWRFEIALTEETRINAFMSFGRERGDGSFEPGKQAAFLLNGCPPGAGPRLIARREGEPAVSPRQGFPQQARWTPVSLWLPLDLVETYPLVRLDGFGNLFPGDLQMGIGGNPPGAAYALRRLLPVWYGASPRDVPMERLGEVIRAPRDDTWRAEWSEHRPHTLKLRNPAAVPPRIEDKQARINGYPVNLEPMEDHWQTRLPLPFPGETGEHLEITFAPSPGSKIDLELSLAQGANVNRPELLALETPGVFTHFNREGHQNLNRFTMGQTGGRMDYDRDSGREFLRLDNDGKQARLAGRLLTNADLIANPVLALAYRAGRFSRVSLEIPGIGLIPFAEELVHDNPPARTDGQWDLFTAHAGNFLSGVSFDQLTVPARAQLRMRSAHRIDQTGRRAWLDFSQLSLGPAVGPERPLRILPSYGAIDGIARVETAVAQGETPPERARQEELEWSAIANNQPHTVDLSRIPNGPGWLLLRAVSNRGTKSRVTEIPFLVDNDVDPATAALTDTGEQGPGTSLRLSVDSRGYSPLRAQLLSLRADNTPIELDSSYVDVAYHPQGLNIEINFPALLRRQLDAAGDGDSLEMVVDGLRDGADNVVPATTVEYKVDYAQDRHPPVIESVMTDESPFFWIGSLGPRQPGFAKIERGRQTTSTNDDGTAHKRINLQRRRGRAIEEFSDPHWQPERHPFLALSMAAAASMEDGQEPATLVFSAAENNAFRDGEDTSRTLSLPLRGNREDLARHMSGSLVWEKEKWNNIIINARDLLREHSAGDEAPAIRSITLVPLRDTNLNMRFRTAAIMKPWQPEHFIDIVAYDASGVWGLAWQTGENAGLRLHPAGLDNDGESWLALMTRDHPGNHTNPVMLPVPPESLPETEDGAEEQPANEENQDQ